MGTSGTTTPTITHATWDNVAYPLPADVTQANLRAQYPVTMQGGIILSFSPGTIPDSVAGIGRLFQLVNGTWLEVTGAYAVLA